MSNEKRRLFQYAVIKHTKEVKDGKETYTGAELIISPQYVLASSEREVMFKVIRDIPEDKAAEPENVEVLIKGF